MTRRYRGCSGISNVVAGELLDAQLRTQASLAPGAAEDLAPHRRAVAAVEQRQFHLLLRRGARQQVEALEHEGEEEKRQPRALVAR